VFAEAQGETDGENQPDDFDCRPRNWVACESPISSYTREATTIGIGRNICGVCD